MDNCKDCKHWKFDHHKTDEDHDVYATVGECRIRSVNEDCFPLRDDDEGCGEFKKKEREKEEEDCYVSCNCPLCKVYGSLVNR